MNQVTPHRRPLTRGGSLVTALLIALPLSLPTAASAAAAPDSDGSEAVAADALPARIVHRPPATLGAGSLAALHAQVERDHLLARIEVHVRPLGTAAPFRAITMKRATLGGYAASLPERLVQPPGIEYYISSVDRDGQRRAHFASEARPQPVVIAGETELTHERDRLARHDGRRNRFWLAGQVTAFGVRAIDSHPNATLPAGEARTDRFSDHFWDLELEYTHRFLGTLYDVRFGVGLLRGQRATLTTTTGDELEADAHDAPDPGFNYGYGEVNFELLPVLSTAVRLTLGASEMGFAAGVGGKVRIGRIAGTHFELSAEYLDDVGARGHARFVWTTVPRLPMGLTIELTDWPDSERNPAGQRLVYDLGYQFGAGVTVTAKGGYVTRAGALDGGFTAGLGAAYEF